MGGCVPCRGAMNRRGHLKTRVISGEFKGKVLSYPADRRLRPTMQRTKSSVFETLEGILEGAVVADLYAAAGGIGIEALSRGASRVHFVESDSGALECLRDNLTRCGIGGDRGLVHSERVMEFLRRGGLRNVDADVIYADPPYEGEEMRLLLEFFDEMDYPSKALLILEHRKDTVFVESLHGLVRTRWKRFGQSCVSYFVPAGGDRS